MESEQYRMHWKDYQNHLTSGLYSLFQEEDLVDVTLVAEGRFLKAHQIVLSVCSSFFKDVFRATPSKHAIVILPDVNYDVLCNILQFMYQGEVSVRQEEMPMIIKVAEMLKVKGLSHCSASNSNDTNEVDNKSSISKVSLEEMQQPRPAENEIKPLQSFESLKSESPPPISTKRPNLDETPISKQEQEYREALLKRTEAEVPLPEGAKRGHHRLRARRRTEFRGRIPPSRERGVPQRGRGVNQHGRGGGNQRGKGWGPQGGRWGPME